MDRAGRDRKALKSHKLTNGNAPLLSIFIRSAYALICCAQHIRLFCPSCQQKIVLLFAEWLDTHILEQVSYGQHVFTISGYSASSTTQVSSRKSCDT